MMIDIIIQNKSFMKIDIIIHISFMMIYISSLKQQEFVYDDRYHHKIMIVVMMISITITHVLLMMLSIIITFCYDDIYHHKRLFDYDDIYHHK